MAPPDAVIGNRDALAGTPARDTALACVEAGIEAAAPERALETAFSVAGSVLTIEGVEYDLDEFDEVVVLGAGKAAGQLAAGIEDALCDRLSDGAVVTNDPVALDPVAVHEGAHPVPDEGGLAGARAVQELAAEADERTLVLAAFTGGGSALLPAPADDVTLADLRAVTTALLDSGAAIGEINAVRKHLSTVKGGGLARAAAPGTVCSLLVSDVVGDRVDVIASGPTVPDPTTFADARDVLDRHGIDSPRSVTERLARGAAGEIRETPTADDSTFERVTNHVLVGAHAALDAARAVAEERGYRSLVLSSRVRGEARESALTHAGIAEESIDTGDPITPPAVVLSGGETTVTITGESDGAGGPNQEFALAAATDLALDPGTDRRSVAIAAIDTDGSDGATDAAGALVDGTTVGADDREAARDALADNDAYGFFEDRNGLVRTGPTGTNVNDLRVLVTEDDETAREQQ